MIVLDTNVLSEALRPSPSAAVLHWLACQEPSGVFTTAITQAEILYGIEALPPGTRRSRLQAAIEKMFAAQFEGRVLPFDESAARSFARIAAARDAAGRPISQFDAMIAAIARSHRAAVATRNTADFERCGIPIVNPWAE
ncbi:MAG: type II toxin-antitoxin system VapC family toxin [Acidobacteriia bacterium]|nr:type II toxin-antitoxin system VapC family toxin [Terriglobia bacterium]